MSLLIHIHCSMKKIVIGVQMNCDKCRSQAMEIAAKHGASSVKIEGDNKLVVIDSEIDSVSLTCCLRKKLCHDTAMIINQQEEEARAENPPPVYLPIPQPPSAYFIVQEVAYFIMQEVPDQPCDCSCM